MHTHKNTQVHGLIGMTANLARWSLLLGGLALCAAAYFANGYFILGTLQGLWPTTALAFVASTGLVCLGVGLQRLGPQLETHVDRLQTEAIVDPLTGIYNRNVLRYEMDRLHAEHERYSTPFAVLMLDIDHFKSINDTYGHAAGDRVIAGTAQRLRYALRKSDLLCRYGGEEFCVICPHTHSEGAAVVAERLRLTIGDVPFVLDEKMVNVTVSIGLCGTEETATPNDEEPFAIVKRADQSLYAAKRGGRNRVCGPNLN